MKGTASFYLISYGIALKSTNPDLIWALWVNIELHENLVAGDFVTVSIDTLNFF